MERIGPALLSKFIGLYDQRPAEYTEAKTAFLTRILEKCGITASELDSISEANRVKK